MDITASCIVHGHVDGPTRRYITYWKLYNMRDEVGGRGELHIFPSEPDLVAAIPSQGVEVIHEGRLLQIFPQVGM